VVLLGVREWAQLAGYSQPSVQFLAAAIAASAMLALFYLVDMQVLRPLWSVAAALWIVLTIALVWRRKPVDPVSGARPLVLLVGLAVLLIAWSVVVVLHASPQGPALVLFLFALIWTADSGAYFAGRAFGRHKLSPAVSPGKTWEGVAGAMLGAVLCALVLSWLALLAAPWGALAVLCLAVTAVSIGGDLFESLLKRQAQLKDSGSLLPGHGGALDRIDSLLAAAPVFVVGLKWLGAA
jgi:phosphatidate cytidylyltransferase